MVTSDLQSKKRNSQNESYVIHLIGAILKWTELGHSGQFEEVKMDGSKEQKWAVMYETGRRIQSAFGPKINFPSTFILLDRPLWS